MFIMNRDEQKRDEIIFGKYEPEKYMGGIRRFEDLTLEKLEKLISWQFIDLEDRHNNCPCAGDIWTFMNMYPGYEATGYAVSSRRSDYRVSLDGLQKNGGANSAEEQAEFEDRFGKADEFNANDAEMYCWFD